MPNPPPRVQLKMFWPRDRRDASLDVPIPAGYSLRTHRPGDETRWFQLMELCGWPGWHEEPLRPWMQQMLPEGWFMAVHDETGVVAASVMGLARDNNAAELGWLVADPAHVGHGLGYTVAAAVTNCMLAAGRDPIYLLTDDHRLPALKSYLKLGYIPQLSIDGMPERWETICGELGWPYTPAEWERQIG